jgi:hypothetical protein
MILCVCALNKTANRPCPEPAAVRPTGAMQAETA